MTMMIKLRDFAELKEEDILRWRGHRLAVEVEDDAGEKVKSDTYSMMLTWQGLIVHRHYSDIPYSVNELVPSTINGSDVVYNDNTLAIPVNYILQEVMPHIHDPLENDKIKRLVHVWQTKLNNCIVVMSEEYAISATDTCVAEIMEDPGMLEIRQAVLSGECTIDEGEIRFAKYIKSAPSLNYNTMALLARTGGVQVNQAYQKIIIRGAVFDLNNQIMPNAIMVPYAHGITNLTDSIGDSRSSGKQLISNGKGLKDSEWFHRQLHLFTAPLRAIDHMTDCGSLSYIPIKITGKDILSACLGKFFKVDDSGSIGLLTKKNMFQVPVGSTLWIRSVAFCNHGLLNDGTSGHVCGRCYGMLKGSLPYNAIMMRDANIGMFSATSICNPLGQGILSTKHYIRNATTKEFEPLARDKNIISSDGNDIYLEDKLCVKGTKLVMPATLVKNLSDLKSLDFLEEISLEKLPYFTEATFRYEVEDPMAGGMTEQQQSVVTAVSARAARLSMDLLKYILKHGWEIINKRFISIDLEQWNHNEPIFSLPFTREDLDNHRQKVENFMTFNKRNTAWKNQNVTPQVFGETLQEFWSLINQEIKGINIIHAEMVLACALVPDPDNLVYGLAMGEQPKRFVSFIECINNRGMGTVMIFQGQQGLLNKLKTFLVKNRQGSPLECFWQLGLD